MIELQTGPFIALLTLIIGLAGTVIGIYVKLTTKQTEQDLRINSLEKFKGHVREKLDDHDKAINDALSEIKDGIHRLELQLAKKDKDGGK